MRAGSQPTEVAWSRRIPTPDIGQYVNPVTVDLGNDGMAPNATFTASGTAQALVGPSGGGDLWSLDQCFLSTSVGQLDGAQCIVYVGPLPLPQNAVTGSLAGGSSQFGMGGVGVPFGWFVYALWTGGTAGATANLRVTGRKTVLSN
jgi:hypothetical protein